MSSPVTALIGVGPGNGAAVARRFASEGHQVALLSRDLPKLEALAASMDGQAIAVACDATQPENIQTALTEVEGRLGTINNLIYNAGSGVFGSVDEVTVEDLEQAWRINTLGLYAAAKAVLPGMRALASGAILVTGATASLRGGANFMAFAQAKAAQRNLTQSLARKVGPDGIHVALVIVDGVIDMPRSRSLMPDRPDEHFMSPDHIADAFWFLSQQKTTAWTFELDLRPSIEKW